MAIDDLTKTDGKNSSFWKLSTLVPVGALVLGTVLKLTHDRVDQLPLPVQVAIALLVLGFVFWCVFVVLGHAEAVAHHIGEPFGTLVLTVAVTAIEASVIVSFMMHGDPNPTIARESVFSTVMIVCGGMVGLCLVLGGWRHRQQELKQQATSALLAVVVALSVLTLVLPNFTLAGGPGDFSSLQLFFVSLLCLMLYGSFIFAQMTRHRADFLDERHAPEMHQSSASSSLVRSLILLAMGLIGIVLLAEHVAASLEQGLEALNLPQTDAMEMAYVRVARTTSPFWTCAGTTRHHSEVTMRSPLDRIRHAISFEVIGLILIVPLGAVVFQIPIHELGVVGVVSATIATLWNFIYNYLFDIAMQRSRGTTHKRGAVRVLHAVLFELGLLIVLMPFIVWYLGVSLWQAFVMDASFALFYMVYAFVFNWAYDKAFPLPEWKTAAQ